MAQTFTISFPVPPAAPVDALSFPSLSVAVRQVAEEAHQQWLAYAQGTPLPGGRSVKDRGGVYAASIKLRQVGDLAAEVYSDAKVAGEVESGTPSRDLKEMLRTSRKTRLNKRGQKFLIIPFRWSQGGGGGTNALPANVANWWKGQAASRVAGWTTRVSATGHEVPQRLYNWGASLEKPDLTRLGIKGENARRMKGMVNFREQSARSAGGASKGGAMTFRTMSEGQTGKWITKPKPGLRVAATVAQQVKPAAEKAFKLALEQDLARLFGKP